MFTRRQFLKQAAITAAALSAKRVFALREMNEHSGVHIEQATIQKFSTRISGSVITPDSPQYESTRIVFNRAFDRRPALIVRCANPADVVESLEFAEKQGLALAIRGGGHSRAGFGVCDGGLVIDLGPMNRVEVERGRRVVRAQSGALVRDVDKATQLVGLATTMGGCPTVGVAGFTLGGGEGLLMSKYGAGCDNLVSARLVTVDGREIQADASSNSDLFWAIRGGGGNFGVVTSLEYRLHPLTDVLAGTITYSPGRISELLRAFARFVAVAPDEMNVVGEVLPTEHGACFHMMVCHCGDVRQGNELLKPLRGMKPVSDTVRVASYLETQTSINPYTAAAHFQTNLFLPELNERAIATLSEATKEAKSGMRVFIVPLYGAISRVKADATAFPLREPGYEIDLMGRWNSASEREEAVNWVRSLHNKLEPLANGVYSNQLGETSPSLVKASYAGNYARLAQIKRKYDPKNVLRLNQNITPL